MPTRVFTDEELEFVREAVSTEAEVLSNSDPYGNARRKARYDLLQRCLDKLWGFDDDTGEIFEPLYSECSVCHGPIQSYTPPSGIFWSHFEHPADEHDAVPV